MTTIPLIVAESIGQGYINDGLITAWLALGHDRPQCADEGAEADEE